MANDAAIDEYALGTTGGGSELEDVQRDPSGNNASAPQLGVLGENETAQSPLTAAGPALWISLGVVVAGGLAAFAWTQRNERPA